MGAALNNQRGRRRGRRARPMSEINVTPLGGVMLVLLIVFMDLYFFLLQVYMVYMF